MGEHLSSNLLSGAVDLLADLGGDALAIARQAGVPAQALTDPALPVLGYAMTDFFELAARELDCLTFGLQMAERSSLAVIGPVWSLLSTAPTIGQMIDDLVDNFAVYSEAALLTLSRSSDGVLMAFEGRAGHCESEVQMVEFSHAITIAEIRRHCPPDWQPAAVLFRHGRPAELAMHRRVFGPNLMFEQDRNAIYIDAASLELSRHLLPEAQRWQIQLELKCLGQEMERSLAAQVEHILSARADFITLSHRRLSAELELATRTLQRRLAGEGTSLKAIKETVRADLAQKYVRQSDLSFSQIAEMLGYSELSAFSRAFHRWYGTTASQVRQRSLRPAQ